MSKKSNLSFKLVFDYVILVIILKSINVILPFNFQYFDAMPIAYIPIGYLVIKNIFCKTLDKMGGCKEDFLWNMVLGYTVINLLFFMPILYDISIVAFLFILKPKNNVDVERETMQYIAEYYEKQANENKHK